MRTSQFVAIYLLLFAQWLMLVFIFLGVTQ
jgi:hypothetical protein